MATKHKVDIFKVFASINNKDQEFYTSLSEEEQKALAPLVLMRWMSGTSSKLQIMMLNEFANRYVFSLADHKKLLMDMLLVCSPGSQKRYSWIKAKGKSTSKTPLLTELIKDTYNYSTMKAIDALPLLDDETLIEMATDLGRQTQEIKDIKKELKARSKNVRI